jgi:PBP1b-binding outer membrane lipoprotein LpoB
MRKMVRIAALLGAPMMLVACGENPEEPAIVEEVPVEQVVDQGTPTDEATGADMSVEQGGDSGPPER